MIDHKLLSAFVAVSKYSMRELSKETGWPQSNMSAAFHGARSLPQKRVFPLLDILQLTEHGLPDSRNPWLASGNEIEDRDALLRVLGHFFPTGAIARQISPDTGIASLKTMSREIVFGVRDRHGIVRVCLNVKRVPEDLDDPDSPAPLRFSERDLATLEIDCQQAVRISRERYVSWQTGDLTSDEFDEDFSTVRVRQPTWKNVVETAKQRGLRPADVLAAILGMKDG